MGIPSSGKSSAAKALAEILGAAYFLEPEEDQWPALIQRRDVVGRFTALTWFRCARLPGLFLAKEVSGEGGIAIVDSYYDKLLALYIDKPEFAWLVPRSDPYFDVAVRMAKEDYERLPTADILIFLKVGREVWLRFMQGRGREFDASAKLTDFFAMQDCMEAACRRFTDTTGVKFIVVEQRYSSPSDTAQLIFAELKESLCQEHLA